MDQDPNEFPPRKAEDKATHQKATAPTGPGKVRPRGLSTRGVRASITAGQSTRGLRSSITASQNTRGLRSSIVSQVGAHAVDAVPATSNRSSVRGKGLAGSGRLASSTSLGASSLGSSSHHVVGAQPMDSSALRLGDSKSKRGISVRSLGVAEEDATPVGAHPSNRSRLGESKAKRDSRRLNTSGHGNNAPVSTSSLRQASGSVAVIREVDSDDLAQQQEAHKADKNGVLPYVDSADPAFNGPGTVGAVMSFGSDGGPSSHFSVNNDASGAMSLPEAPVPVLLNTEGLAVANPIEEVPNPLDLPTATDFDEEAQKKRRRKNNKTNRLFLVVGGVVVLGIVILVVALVVGRDKDSKEFVPVSSAPSLSPSLAPTSISDSIMDLLPEWTYEALGVEGSPSARAFDWLLQDTNLNQYPDWRILQRFALATLYYATGGDTWYNNTGWLTTPHECNWPNFNNSVGAIRIIDESTGEPIGYEFHSPGSLCYTDTNASDIDNELVRHVWLADNGLQGSIPAEISLLPDLQNLYLAENGESLYSSIPKQIGRMTHLEGIALSFTNFGEGGLPSELGLLTGLRFLFTSGSNVGGTLPTELGLLTSLEMISFPENPAITGTLPTQLGLMESLRVVYGYRTGLNGTLPTQLGLLSNATEFRFGRNSLEGQIPTELGLISSLDYLDVAFNFGLTGQIPSEIGVLPLTWLNVQDNALTGPLPSELGGLDRVYYFDFSDNQLTGSIPTEYGNIGKSGVVFFQLQRNQLTGLIPSELGQIPYIRLLSLQTNNFSGQLPSELTNVLSEFRFSDTDLTGTVPSEVCPLGNSNCTYFAFWMGRDAPCVLDFECSSTLCGCGCPCSNATNLNVTEAEPGRLLGWDEHN